jgi:hypothetical protein
MSGALLYLIDRRGLAFCALTRAAATATIQP